VSRSNRDSSASLPIGTSATLLVPRGRSNTPGPSLRQRSRSFFSGLFRRSGSTSPSSLPDSHGSHLSDSLSPVPSDIPPENLQQAFQSRPPRSNPSIVVNIEPPTNDTTLSLPPSTTLSSTGPLRPHSSATTEPGPSLKATVTPSVTAVERSWEGIGWTVLHGLRVALQIAAESADALPPLKSALGGVRAVLNISGSHRGLF
jgi:hypothetical protein